MMSTQKRGRSRRSSIAGRIREGVRRFLSVVLSVSMVAVSMPAIPAYAATNDDDDVQEFSLSSENLKEALKDALIKGKTVDENKYAFSGAAQDAYEDIFYGADVFELDPEIEDDKDGKLTLKVFARLSADHDLDSLEISGDDEIIFLLLNRSKEEETARIYIDKYATDLITVVPKSEVLLEAADEEPEAEEEPEEIEIIIEDAEVFEAATPVTEEPGAGGAGAGGSSYGADDGLPRIEAFDDGSESSEDADSAYEDASSDEDTADADEADDESSGHEHGSAGDDAGSADADSESSESGNADSSDGQDSGSGSSSESSGSSDGADSGSDGSEGGSESSGGSTESSDSGSGSSDSGSSESSEGGSESSGGNSGSSVSGSESSGSSSASSDSGSGSSGNTESSGSSGRSSESSGSSSSSGSSESSSSGSSSGSSDSGSGSAVASISMHEVGRLAASLGDIVIEIDGDEVVATLADADDNVIDSEVIIASASDADTDDDGDDETSSSGYIDIEGEVYQAVLSGKKNSAVAFVTTFEKIGMEEGVTLEARVFTASDDGINVEVIAPAGALPDDAELSVTRYLNDTEEFAAAADAIGRDAGDTNMAALDISFFDADGEEIEPSDEVQVIIDVSDILPENADASTLKVTHLEDRSFLFGLFKWVKSVVVADEDEGYIDEDNAIIEFSVDNFSVFTVTWDDGTETTIEVHVYSVNGTSIDEELDTAYTSTSSVITISNLVSHLEQNASYTNTYTYRYATVVYETQQGGGYSSTTIGGQDNSVSSISKSGTTYTVTTSSGTTTVTDPADIVIHLYYSIPEVTLATEDPYAETVEFTTSSNYFVGDTSDATYTWALSDDTLGTLTHPTSGQATFTWSDSAQSGDQVTVTVTMTVGEETASDTYTLTYGDDPITFTVYSQDGTTPQENARVALVDASGNTVATGTTGADGTVTLYAPAGEYTVGVTYVYLVSEAGGGSTSRATAETTITVSDDETATGSVTLGTAVTSGPGGDTSGSNGGGSEPYYYEHIDVKVAVAETSDSNVSFSDLDAVYVYDKYGNLLYVSEDINANPGTTDYNVLFDINANEDQHSIVVSSEDTIVLVYEVKDNETGEFSTYTVSYRSEETYPEDEYYPYTAINAYQLYNNLYDGNYASQEAFEAAWESGQITGEGYNTAGIPVGGVSYTLVADYLCDTRTTTGQAGLDFVIYVQELDAVQDAFDFRVAKTVENVPGTFGSEDIENFTFTLQELDKVRDDGDYTEAIWSTEEGNVLSTDTESISSYTNNNDGTWSGILDFLGALQYEAEDGTNFYYYILSEQTPTTATPTQQYYGLKVTVTYSAATGTATVVVSYCTLGTQDNYPYYRTSGWTGLTAYTDTDDEGEEYTYYSIPFVNTYSTTGFELEKVDDSENLLGGAVFTMKTTQIEGEGTTLYFTFETVDGTPVYTLASSDTGGASQEIAIINGGPVSIQGIAAGTYTLTETTKPEGYAAVDDFTVTIDDEGNVTVAEDNSNVTVDDDDVVTVTDNELTSIKGSKSWAYDEEGNRPDSITVYLVIENNENETGYELVYDSDGKPFSATATADDDWEWIIEGIPKYDSDGNEIKYLVREDEVIDSAGTGYLPSYTTDSDGNITITNSIPVVGKVVSDPAFGESTDDNLHDDEADNNDTLEYKMEADHIGGAHNLVLHDFLDDQLDIDTLSIQSVTLYADENDSGTPLTEDVDYTVSYGDCTADCGLDGCSFEVHVFDEDLEDLSADAYVIVIFDIDVKEGVEDFDDSYVDEVDNFVGLSFTVFSIRTYADDDGEEHYEIEEEEEHAEPDETETFSYGFDIFKYTGDDIPLAGAGFVLMREEDGEESTITQYAQFDYESTSDESSSAYILTGWTDSESDATAIVSGNDGNAVVEGLHEGSYILKETKAPSGYTIAEEITTVEIIVTGSDLEDYINPTIIVNGSSVSNRTALIENPPESTTSGGGGGSHGSSGGGGGSSSSGGSGVGGPGDGGSSGDGDTWDLLPLPSTGQGRAMLFGAIALAVSAMALIVLLWYKRRETKS